MTFLSIMVQASDLPVAAIVGCQHTSPLRLSIPGLTRTGIALGDPAAVFASATRKSTWFSVIEEAACFADRKQVRSCSMSSR